MILVIVGSTRPQNGHWKSDHITMVTGASLSPRRGSEPCSVLLAVFGPGSPAAAGGGGGGAALSRPFLVSSAYRFARLTPLISFSSAFLITSSKVAMKASIGWAPRRLRTLV